MISIVARLETLDGCTQTVDLESYLIEPPEIIRMPMAYPPDYPEEGRKEYRLFILRDLEFLGSDEEGTFYMTEYLEKHEA